MKRLKLGFAGTIRSQSILRTLGAELNPPPKHHEPCLMPRERRRVHYSGRVQGVGFRFVSQRLAQGFDVAGYVRNLEDGRVELLAEGEPTELDAFLAAIERELGDKIRHTHAERESGEDPPLSKFTIRY